VTGEIDHEVVEYWREDYGTIAGVTSTVGHHFKIVGRVGDSPIIGAGLYVDDDVGAAGATGHGAECVKNCGSFLVVEKMREGLSPEDACRFVCQQVTDRHQGRPLFNLKFVALDKQGRYGCCSVQRLWAFPALPLYDAKVWRTRYGRPIRSGAPGSDPLGSPAPRG
jgi:N4-(beta-N-acetylglucosaminyl)-L-asparaginase